VLFCFEAMLTSLVFVLVVAMKSQVEKMDSSPLYVRLDLSNLSIHFCLPIGRWGIVAASSGAVL